MVEQFRPHSIQQCYFLFINRTPVKYFDVPSEEQDIMTAEERQILSEGPKTIQQVMKDVVVYVEVRYENDNRTEGIKKVISQLGAKVNNTLLRCIIKHYRLKNLF